MVQADDGSSEQSIMIGVLQMNEHCVGIGRSLGLHSVKLSIGLDVDDSAVMNFNSCVKEYKSCAADLNSERA